MTSVGDALRANVRLLGDLLGRVLVEQDGTDVFEAEERIRLLSREAPARGGGGASPELTAAVRAPTGQATVLRAFGVYFQLVNIAEQHHRVRRRREYEHRGGRRASRSGRVRPARRGRRRRRRASGGGGTLSVWLVFTAHPTEAARRTILAAHRRVAALLGELDDPLLTPSGRDRIERALAEEITILWQTDELRSRRPHVVDEIRHGLWFFEESLWEAAPRLVGQLRRRLPGAPPPLAFGTWIGLLDASLRAHRGERIADGGLTALRRRVELFGFHVAKLDLRVHARAVREPDPRIRELLRAGGRVQRRHGRRAPCADG